MEETLEIGFDLVGKTLEQDIYSELNLLLLKKGSVLTEANIVLLKKHNYQNIKVSEKVTFKKAYLNYIGKLRALFEQIHDQDTSSLQQFLEENEKFFKFIVKNPGLSEEIYTLDDEAPAIIRHSANVGIVSAIIGKVLGYSTRSVRILWQMGFLHDVGRLKLLDENDEQYLHINYGLDLVANIPNVDTNICNAIKFHHEKIDGTGYPNRLKVNDIPLMVQIVSVANLYDKLSLTKESSLFSVLEELMEQTQQNKLNPAIVIPFVRYKYYQNVGKEIILSDLRKAKIIFIHDNEPIQPLVHIEETDEYIDLRKYHNLKVINFFHT